jgi:hypothetical protein
MTLVAYDLKIELGLLAARPKLDIPYKDCVGMQAEPLTEPGHRLYLGAASSFEAWPAGPPFAVGRSFADPFKPELFVPEFIPVVPGPITPCEVEAVGAVAALPFLGLRASLTLTRLRERAAADNCEKKADHVRRSLSLQPILRRLR